MLFRPLRPHGYRGGINRMYCLFCGTQCSLYSHKANELNLQLGVVVGGGINSQVTAKAG